MPIVIKDDILVQRKSIENQRKTQKKKEKEKEIGFPIKAEAICYPDTAKPKLENNFVTFIYHLICLISNFKFYHFPPPLTYKGYLLPPGLKHPTKINSPTTQSKYSNQLKHIK